MIDHTQILSNFYIGTYPQSFDDIQHLKDCRWPFEDLLDARPGETLVS